MVSRPSATGMLMVMRDVAISVKDVEAAMSNADVQEAIWRSCEYALLCQDIL